MLDPKSRSGRRRRISRLYRLTRFFVISLLVITLTAAFGGAVYLVGRWLG